MIGGQRKQNALYGKAPSASGVELQPNGRGGQKVVTSGSVIDNGGGMKMGMFPTVGVGLSMLNLSISCCKCDSGACRTGVPCYNTTEPGTSCSKGWLFSNCSRVGVGSACR